MKEKTKYTLKILFGSLLKNDYAVEGAKTFPWWVAVILFILGTFLPIVPIMVNASKTYGASFASSYVYDFDQALVSCSVKMKKLDSYAGRDDLSTYSFKVDENNQLLAYKDNSEEPLSNTWLVADGETESQDLTPIVTYNTVIEGKTNRALNIYYSDRSYNSSVYSIKQMVKTIEATKYIINSVEVASSDTNSADTYIPSYLLLYKDGLYAHIYKTGTTTSAATSYGGLNWNHNVLDGQDLLEYVVNVDGLEINLRDPNYVSGSMDKWKIVFNKSYLDQKTYNFWFSSGLYYGIYLVLGLFMGLMMWLLTRGKHNPNRNIGIFNCFKISWWIDVTPGLLGLIIGFIWSQAAGLAYIVFIGLRTMWLSMRQLSPAQQQ